MEDGVDGLDDAMDKLGEELAESLSLADVQAWLDQEPRKPPAQMTLEQIVDKIRSGAKVVTMAGAGLSVSAGIPDFRTPGTGL